MRDKGTRNEGAAIKGLTQGAVGDPFLVLTLPEIRAAEILKGSEAVDTADGTIAGRPGDVVIFTESGERYPIRASIFYGTYDVVAQVGPRLVARRLIHVRRAWTVVSEDTVFSYDENRGTIPVQRDSWIYQSDDDDFGVINRDLKLKAHAALCSPTELDDTDWQARVRRRALWLSCLPALLSLIAVVGFGATLDQSWAWVAPFLVEIEILLLVAGAVSAWQMSHQRWPFRAAAQVGLLAARDYQVAVKLLGHRASHDFPGMAIWRGAQMTPPSAQSAASSGPALDAASHLADLKTQMGRTLEEADRTIHREHTIEKMATIVSWSAIAMMASILVYLLIDSHFPALELFAIWLPSAIACMHSLANRKYRLASIAALKEYRSAIRFLQSRTFALAPAGTPAQGSHMHEEFQAVLQALCRVVGSYAQRRLSFAIYDEPEPPI